MKHAVKTIQRASSIVRRRGLRTSAARGITHDMIDRFTHYALTPIPEQVKLLAQGQITPESLHQSVRFGAALFDPTIGAVQAMYSHVPEEGIPCLVKDSMPVKEQALRCGLPVKEGLVQTLTSPFVRFADLTLRKHYGFGLTPVGSTKLPRVGSHSYTPGVINPLDGEYISGGSSGGMGAAIAAGIARCAYGTDIGGSDGIPAFYQGLSRVLPPANHALRIDASLAKGSGAFTKESLKELQQHAYQTPTAGFHRTVLGGMTPLESSWLYALSIGENPDEFMARMREEARKPKKIGILPYTPTSSVEHTDPSLIEAIHDIAKRMSQAGSGYEYVILDPKALQAVETNDLLTGFCKVFFPHIHGTNTAFRTQCPSEQLFDPKDPTAAFGMLVDAVGASVTPEEREHHLSNFAKMRTRFEEVMDTFGFDAIVYPAVGRIARPQDVMHSLAQQQQYLRLVENGDTEKMVKAAVQSYERECLPTMYTNMCGAPATSLPNPWYGKNIPIGMRLMGRPEDMERVIQTTLGMDLTLGISERIEVTHLVNRTKLIEQALSHHRTHNTENHVVEAMYGGGTKTAYSWVSQIGCETDVEALAKRDREALDNGKIVVASITPLTSLDQKVPYEKMGFFIAPEWNEQRVHIIVAFKDPNTHTIDTITAYGSPSLDPTKPARLMLRGPKDPVGLYEDYISQQPGYTNPVATRDRKAIIDPSLRRQHRTSSIVVSDINLHQLSNAVRKAREETQKMIETNPNKLPIYHTDFFPYAEEIKTTLMQLGKDFGNCLSAVLKVWEKGVPGRKLPLPADAVVPSFVSKDQVEHIVSPHVR